LLTAITLHRIGTEPLRVITRHVSRTFMPNPHLLAKLREQLHHEEEEIEVYARKIRQANHSIAKLLYSKLMRDSMQHADVLNTAIAYVETDRWERLSPTQESREELIRLMNLEDTAARLFSSASAEVRDPHLKNLLNMLAFDEEQHYSVLRYVLENFVEKRKEAAHH